MKGLEKYQPSIWKSTAIRNVLVLLLLVLILVGNLQRDTANQRELLIGAAASTKPAMEELLSQYRNQNSNIALQITYASSGTLEQQIRQGAPMDVFLSAAQENMDSLSKDHLIIDRTRVELLKNQLVLIEPNSSKLKLQGFADIPKVSKIALGEPSSVPAGKYAYEVFLALGLWEEVKDVAIYGRDVTEVLAWVASQNVDAGVVYATEAVISDKVRIVATAPEDTNSKIIYSVTAVKGTKKDKAAMEFISYLSSPEALEIWLKYGFIPISSTK